MSEHEDCLRLMGDEVLHQEVEAIFEWFRHWHCAWNATAENGGCDDLGGREYARLTAEARIAGVPANQSVMRGWIRLMANLPVPETITQESLARRAIKRGGENAD